MGTASRFKWHWVRIPLGVRSAQARKVFYLKLFHIKI
uniref:Uncharacterized protein n=1 Tax=Myoviridae sp. ctPuP5 TaxID=2823543 RepID=A0A8S5L999_9CAUD|nr:MAG TPA: hypothetical protein [Myoviridae sp. ctPuP5]